MMVILGKEAGDKHLWVVLPKIEGFNRAPTTSTTTGSATTLCVWSCHPGHD
jgi:hypothetical protein